MACECFARVMDAAPDELTLMAYLSDDLLHVTGALSATRRTGLMRCADCARRSRWQRTGWV